MLTVATYANSKLIYVFCEWDLNCTSATYTHISSVIVIFNYFFFLKKVSKKEKFLQIFFHFFLGIEPVF